jgi:hypothetical protein
MSLRWRRRGETYRLAPMGYAGLLIAVSLASPLLSGRALANWYGQYIGPTTCTPIDHISIGSDGTVTAIHHPGKLRTPEDFASVLRRVGLTIKLQTTEGHTNIRVYSWGAVNHTFKFFTDLKACLGDANALLGSPSSVGEPALSSSPSVSPKIQPPVAAPPPSPTPTATAAVPISPLPILPQAAAVPAPARVWIIIVLFGNDPMGTPLSQFYRTKKDCVMGITRAEIDPLIRGATGKGKFKLDCLQLTEAQQQTNEIDPARLSAHRVHRGRPHPTQLWPTFETPALSNEPPPSERSYPER